MHQNIGEFEVPMHYFVLHQSLEGVENLNKELNGLLLSESFLFLQVVR